MYLEILFAILLGVFSGCITGLLPGIHVNLISLMVVNYALILLKLFTPLEISVFLLSMGITHTFLDVIPAVFLGAPEEGTSLIVLPAHKLLFQGKGLYAVTLATLGGVFSLITLILLSPLLFYTIKLFYSYINIKYFLLILSLFLILRNHSLKSKLWAFLIFSLSGSLGLIVLNSNFKNPMHPLFSGLFGLSVIFFSLSKTSILPKQINSTSKFKIPKAGVLAACVGGVLTGLMPAVTSSIAAVIGKLIFRNLNDEGYITLVGGSNTANFIVSLFLFYLAGKTRNGILIGVKQFINQISFIHILLFISVALIVAGLSAFLTIELAGFLLNVFTKINYKILSITVAIILILSVFIFAGHYGLLILTVATAIGLLPHYTGVGKYTCMGSLIIPILINLI